MRYKDKRYQPKYQKMYRERNAKKRKKYIEKYNKINKEKISKRKKEYNLKNRNKILKRLKDYYCKHRKEISVKDKTRRQQKSYIKYRKEYCIKNRESLKLKRKIYNLKKKYNLSVEEYDRMVGVSGGKCEICRIKLNIFRTNSPKPTDVCVDHNHKNGVVRGLLCSNCNLALGLINDKNSTLINMIDYLKKYENTIRI